MGVNANVGMFSRPSAEDRAMAEEAARIAGVSEYLNLNVDANVGMSQGRVRRIVSWLRKLYGYQSLVSN